MARRRPSPRLSDGADPETGWRIVGVFGNLATPWALVALFLGRTAGELRWGALAGGLATVIGVVVYYGVAVIGLGSTGYGSPPRFGWLSPPSPARPSVCVAG